MILFFVWWVPVLPTSKSQLDCFFARHSVRRGEIPEHIDVLVLQDLPLFLHCLGQVFSVFLRGSEFVLHVSDVKSIVPVKSWNCVVQFLVVKRGIQIWVLLHSRLVHFDVRNIEVKFWRGSVDQRIIVQVSERSVLNLLAKTLWRSNRSVQRLDWRSYRRTVGLRVLNGDSSLMDLLEIIVLHLKFEIHLGLNLVMVLQPLVIFFKLLMLVIHFSQPLHSFIIVELQIRIHTLWVEILILENRFCGQVLVYLVERLLVLFLQFFGVSIFKVVWYW